MGFPEVFRLFIMVFLRAPQVGQYIVIPQVTRRQLVLIARQYVLVLASVIWLVAGL